MYKFVGVNVSHPEFIKRYGRLGPRELSAPSRLGDEEMEAITCTKLADALLIRDRHDPDSKSKYEVGKTKIFIRWGFSRPYCRQCRQACCFESPGLKVVTHSGC